MLKAEESVEERGEGGFGRAGEDSRSGKESPESVESLGRAMSGKFFCRCQLKRKQRIGRRPFLWRNWRAACKGASRGALRMTTYTNQRARGKGLASWLAPVVPTCL